MGYWNYGESGLLRKIKMKVIQFRYLSLLALSALVTSVSSALDETNLVRFDQILSDMESGDIIPLRTEATRRIVLSNTAREAGREFEDIGPAEREKIVRELLGDGRYDRAVDVFVEQLSNPIPEYRMISANFLGEAMGATGAIPALRTQLKFEGAGMFEDLEVPDNFKLNISSLLAEAEALAYLRDSQLIETGLLMTLLESNPPPESAARIIRAMAYAEVPGWQERISPFLISEHTEEAKAAFKALGRPEFQEAYAETLMYGAKSWIPVIRNDLESNGKLEWPHRVLLSMFASTGASIFREITSVDINFDDVAADLKFLAENGVEFGTKDTAISLFRFVQNDENVAWLCSLLRSSSAAVRESALNIIARTVSPELIVENAQAIFPLLDDANRMVQGFAVFALQSGLELPAANLYSDSELEEAKSKILEAYGNKGIVPDSGGNLENENVSEYLYDRANGD